MQAEDGDKEMTTVQTFNAKTQRRKVNQRIFTAGFFSGFCFRFWFLVKNKSFLASWRLGVGKFKNKMAYFEIPIMERR
jgi:hypothetical protein